MRSSYRPGPGNSHSDEDCCALTCDFTMADLTTEVKVSWSFSRFHPILENFKTRLFHIKNSQLFVCSGQIPQITGTGCIHLWSFLISETSYPTLLLTFPHAQSLSFLTSCAILQITWNARPHCPRYTGNTESLQTSCAHCLNVPLHRNLNLWALWPGISSYPLCA